jgi:hemolysin III
MSIAATPKQEVANAITHGIGAIWAIIGTVVLAQHANNIGNTRLLICFVIYGCCMTFLFAASTIYHSFHSPKTKKVLRVFDHIGIYLMIAGTYTPFLLVSLPSNWGNPLAFVIWGIAIAGILFKLFFTGKYEWVSLASYLAMGWLVIVATKPMLDVVPVNGLWLLLAGGLCFSAGVVFYRWHSLYYHHAIWHVFVMAGGACHYFAILLYSYPKMWAL